MTSDRTTRPKPQATSEPKATPTASVTRSVIASASNFGIRVCNQCCSGQTSAMMKSARASGANTLLAYVIAATTAPPAMILMLTFIFGWPFDEIVWKRLRLALASRQSRDLQAVAEAGHEPRREWPGMPRFGNCKIRVLAHELPAHAPRLATRAR